MRRLPFFLLLILIALQWPLWNGYWSLLQTRKEIDTQQKANQELIYRNLALQADIRDLKQGNDAVQERARLQLGMVKSDEVFVQVMDQPSVLAVGSNPLPTAVSSVAEESKKEKEEGAKKDTKPVTPISTHLNAETSPAKPKF